MPNLLSDCKSTWKLRLESSEASIPYTAEQVSPALSYWLVKGFGMVSKGSSQSEAPDRGFKKLYALLSLGEESPGLSYYCQYGTDN